MSTPSNEDQFCQWLIFQGHHPTEAHDEAGAIFADLHGAGFAVIKVGEVPPWMDEHDSEPYEWLFEEDGVFYDVDHTPVPPITCYVIKDGAS